MTKQVYDQDLLSVVDDLGRDLRHVWSFGCFLVVREPQ